MVPFRCTYLCVHLLALVAGVPLSTTAQPSLVDGTVQDPDGRGVPYANVQIDGTTDGTATDSTGRFRFRTRQSGALVLRASAVGYESAERSLSLRPGDTVSVQIELSPSRVQLEETVVTDDAYSTGPGSDATLSPTEAVTTPGAAGDLLRALHSFPGVASPGDGAGLYVRGGDVSETKTVLDQAPVHHPYRYESPAGGSFGAVPSFLVDGTHLSTGGFSAQYGDALSGVLALASKDRPTSARQYVDLGLAGTTFSVDQPLVDDRLGLRVSGNRSFTGLLFRANGQREDFETVPQGLNGTLALTLDTRDTGQLKLLSFGRTTRLGVEAAEGNHRGVYRSRSTNRHHSLQWTTGAGTWTTEAGASWSVFSSDRSFGGLDLEPRDATATLRLDATRTADAWTIRAGGVLERRRYQLDGQVPTQPDAVTPDAPLQSLDTSLPATRSGVYTELESSLFSPIGVQLGVRSDYHSKAREATVDPRLQLSWRLSAHTHLQTAWGIYHQFPPLSTYSRHTGDRSLTAQRAEHVVLSLRHERDDLLMRAEVYQKPYRDLVVRTGPARYENAGSGRARGLDLFAKYGSFLETRINGWVSYSLLTSHRTQPRDLGSTVELDRGPAPYDLTHQAVVVGKVRVVDQLRLGGTYRYTTGRPFTPVVDTRRTNEGTVLPVDGPVGSERLSPYHRLDLQLSYFWPFSRKQNVVFYAAVNNVLDRATPVDLSYSADYSEREYRQTNFRRSIYVGCNLTL